MSTELDLKLPAPEVPEAEIAMVVQVLANAGDWLTAREIANLLAMREGSEAAGESAERHVRKIASAAAPVIVSYPGSPGYKLWQLCSVEEINHCIEAIESQAKDMLKRSVLYRQAYHKRFRGAPGGELGGCEAPPAPAKSLFR